MDSQSRAETLHNFTLQIAQSEDDDIDRMICDAFDRMCLDIPDSEIDALAKEWRPIVVAILDSRGPQ